MEVVNSSMIYLIYCKNFYKSHTVPPPSTTIKINCVDFLIIGLWFNSFNLEIFVFILELYLFTYAFYSVNGYNGMLYLNIRDYKFKT
jgi:hypothetical protein